MLKINLNVLSIFLNLLTNQLESLLSPTPEGTVCCKDIYKSVEKGHLECLKYFHSSTKDFRWDPFITRCAAGNQHLDCLKYAHENGCEWHPYTKYQISRPGNFNLEILKYVHENGCPWTNDTSYRAARFGNLEFLKYAHENGCPFDKYTIKEAASNGHLEIIKYLYEQCEVEWGNATTYKIVMDGNLECLKYVREHGCPWADRTTCSAAYSQNLDCLLYCLDNDCPIHPETLKNLYNPNDKKIDKNLITNLFFRKVLLHPKLKDEISYEKYPKFVELIEEYREFKIKVYTLFKSNTNLPTDVIKYKILKYI